MAADLDQLEASLQHGVEVCARANVPYGYVFELWLGIASFWRGRWAEARDRAEVGVSLEPPGFTVGFGRSYLFLCECFLGHKETALALLDECRTGLPRAGRPNTAGAWTLLLSVIEGLAALREREAAAELYPLALEAIETGSVVSWIGHRLVQTVAGIASARPPAGAGSRPRLTTRLPSVRPTRSRFAASSRRGAAGTCRCS